MMNINLTKTFIDSLRGFLEGTNIELEENSRYFNPQTEIWSYITCSLNANPYTMIDITDSNKSDVFIPDWMRDTRFEFNLIKIYLDITPGKETYRIIKRLATEPSETSGLEVEYHIENPTGIKNEDNSQASSMSLIIVAHDIARNIINQYRYSISKGNKQQRKPLDIREMLSDLYKVPFNEVDINIDPSIKTCQRKYIDINKQSIAKIKQARNMAYKQPRNITSEKSRSIAYLKLKGFNSNEIGDVLGETEQQIKNFIKNHKDLIESHRTIIESEIGHRQTYITEPDLHEQYKHWQTAYNEMNKNKMIAIVYLRQKRVSTKRICEVLKVTENQAAGYVQEFNKHLDYIKLILEPYRDLIEIEQSLINNESSSESNKNDNESSKINVYKNNKDQQRIISIIKQFIKIK